MSNLANIAIGLIVVGLLLVRQLQPRPARETSSIRLVLILAAAGIAEITKTTGTRHLTTAAVAWLTVSLMAGAGLGAIRAATVRIWRDQDGSAWRQGTILTAALWLISLAAHLALDTIIDHTSRIAALGTSSILLYLAVTLAVQRPIVRRRTAPLAPAEGHHPRWTPPSRSATHIRPAEPDGPARADRPNTGPRSVHARPARFGMRVDPTSATAGHRREVSRLRRAARISVSATWSASKA